MLYGEIIAVCSEIHTKHINRLCGQNVELLKVKPDVTIAGGCTNLSLSFIKSDFCGSAGAAPHTLPQH
jgi:hypothetical protein